LEKFYHIKTLDLTGKLKKIQIKKKKGTKCFTFKGFITKSPLEIETIYFDHCKEVGNENLALHENNGVCTGFGSIKWRYFIFKKKDLHLPF
jgi:hypothetical protein